MHTVDGSDVGETGNGPTRFGDLCLHRDLVENIIFPNSVELIPFTGGVEARCLTVFPGRSRLIKRSLLGLFFFIRSFR